MTVITPSGLTTTERLRFDHGCHEAYQRQQGAFCQTIGPAHAGTYHPECPDEDDPLLRLSRAIALVETIEGAMRTHEEDPELGPICVCLELARKQLARAHGAVDLALQGMRT